MLRTRVLWSSALRFTKDFAAPDMLPAESITEALRTIQSGRLHRYQHAHPASEGQVAALEKEFARMMGTRYCSAVNSCGAGLFLALKALGVRPGDQVLVNAHTLAPVPGAITHAGAVPVFVNCDDGCVIDINELEAQLVARPVSAGGPSVLMLSHMRSRICDLTTVAELCKAHGVKLVEDCAHSLGSTWDGKAVGSFGDISCYSTQTNKIINSGEGGLVTTNDDVAAGRLILHSGSYGFYAAGHPLLPPEELMEELHHKTPNFSTRMTEVVAALVRPQLHTLDTKVAKLNQNYRDLLQALSAVLPSGAVKVPARSPREGIVGSSLQFELNPAQFGPEAVARVVGALNDRGVKVAWFGRPEFLNFTSTFRHWEYTGVDCGELEQTARVQQNLVDVGLYHTMTWTNQDFELIGKIVQEVVTEELNGVH